jgi:hypothetical protein
MIRMKELIKWINEKLHSKIKAVVPTHFMMIA